MLGLTTAELARACRIFLTLAYPGGAATIPEKRRAYLHLAEDVRVSADLPPAEVAKGIGQVLQNTEGGLHGYSLRLGSSSFPHLKLRMTDYNHGAAWVFGVDTHDAFPRGVLEEGSAEHAAWTLLQLNNRQLKEAIERAWGQEGLWTFHKLLKLDLEGLPAQP